ncbi:MAG: hypothetical protein PHQ11_10880 [Paludibacter sp.]|nr:hypothetical protein [Paludibacter sp.]MDD4198909.1 hypothetical protein [Paludibacter sp.]MDD4428470.1 hypothetical protein [Paludibacter sp.]
MVTVLIQHISTALPLIRGAHLLAQKLEKQFGLMMLGVSEGKIERQRIALESLMLEMNINFDFIAIRSSGLKELNKICEKEDVSFLYIQILDLTTNTIRKHLNACCDLRIPYVIYKDRNAELKFDKVIVPVNFLIEEIEKAQFAAAFGRFCNSELTLLQAKDYGSKAATNVAKISLVLDKFNLAYQVEKGRKDSFKIELDAVNHVRKRHFDFIIASASREYGLDDVFFGPKELHLIRKSPVPVMLINPRGDLYVLCD